MRLKKLVSVVLCTAMLLTTVQSVNIMAVTPTEKISVILPGNNRQVQLLAGETDIYSVTTQSGKCGLFLSNGSWLIEAKYDSISPFDDDGYSIVCLDGKYGIINRAGQVCINPEWDSVRIDCGLVIVSKNAYFGVYGLDGSKIQDAEFMSVDSFRNGYAAVCKNGKFGYIDMDGRLAVDTIWNDTTAFSDGLAAVYSTGTGWGYIDIAGNNVIPCKFENISNFTKGYAIVKEKTDYAVVINKNGATESSKALKIALDYGCDGTLAPVIFCGTQTNVACIKLYGESKYCYIDDSYRKLTESKYDMNVPFDDTSDSAAVCVNEKYDIIKIDNSKGISIKTVLTGKEFAEVKEINNRVVYCADQRYYNISGTDIFGASVDDASGTDNNQDLFTASKDGKYIVSEYSGNVLSALSDYRMTFIKDDTYLAYKRGDAYLRDRANNLISGTSHYSDAYFENGYIYYYTNGKWGLMNTAFKTVIEPLYDGLYSISENMIQYKISGKYGFINMISNAIIPAKFNKLSDYKDGYAWVTEDLRTGAIDKNGNYTVKPLYWSYEDDTSFGCNRFSHGVTSVKRSINGKYEIIDTNGNRLTNNIYNFVGAFSDSGVAIFCDSLYFNNDTCDEHAGLIKIDSIENEVKPESISTDILSVTIYKLGCKNVTATVLPETATDKTFTYTSSNEKIATVDGAGTIYGVECGSTVVTVTSNGNTSLKRRIYVTVYDRAVHKNSDIIPLPAWEEQTWLADVVIARLKECSVTKTIEQLTYGDLLNVYNIAITSLPEKDDNGYYYIPELFGYFTNLISFRFGYEVYFDGYSEFQNNIIQQTYRHDSYSVPFSPFDATKPVSAKWLSNLKIFDCIHCFENGYQANKVRNNAAVIPDKNLYKELVYSSLGDNIYGLYTVNKGIKNLKGLSLFNFSTCSSIDLSGNDLTSITELEKLNLFNAEINLDRNCLDVNSTEVINVINKLTANNCTVTTNKQDETYLNCDISDELTMSVNGYKHFENVYYCSHNKEAFTVKSSNTNVLGIDFYDNGELFLYAHNPGTAILSFYSGNSLIKACTVTVEETPPKDTKDFSLSVTYYGTYAKVDLNVENDYVQRIEYRLKGSAVWHSWDRYDGAISHNCTYEFRYVNNSGSISDIKEVNITDIKLPLTKEQMPDANLRKALGENVCEGQKIDQWTSFANCGITDLTGLSLVDLSDMDYIDLSKNNISNIDELKKCNPEAHNFNLDYNLLDLENDNVNNVLSELINVCSVTTDNQNTTGNILIFNYDYINMTFNNTGGYSVNVFSHYDETSNFDYYIEGDSDIFTTHYDSNGYIWLYSGEKAGKCKLVLKLDGEIVKKVDLICYDKNKPPVNITTTYNQQNNKIIFCFEHLWLYGYTDSNIMCQLPDSDDSIIISNMYDNVDYHEGTYRFCFQSAYYDEYSNAVEYTVKQSGNYIIGFAEDSTECDLLYCSNPEIESGKLSIPQSIDGKTVTKILNYAFSLDCDISVEIPPTVTALCSNAFVLNGHKITISVPDTVTFVDSSFINYYWQDDVTIICSEGSTVRNTFIDYDFNFVIVNGKLNDKTTGTSIEVFEMGNAFDGDAVLTVEKTDAPADIVEQLEDKNYEVLDITIKKDNTIVQPKGETIVTLTVPDNMNGKYCEVFRIESDKSLTNMNVQYDGINLLFKTTHFSQYAIVEQIPEKRLGDANNDGAINMKDAEIISQYIAGFTEDIVDFNCDIDNDGEITNQDIAFIFRYILNSRSSFDDVI